MKTTKDYEAKHAARVARGAEGLDRRHPVNGYVWFNKVQLTTLDLGNPFKCVLGQLRGYYFNSLEKEFPRAQIEGRYKAARRNGFDLGNSPLSQTGKERKREWRALTNLWKAEIRKRRAARHARS